MSYVGLPGPDITHFAVMCAFFGKFLLLLHAAGWRRTNPKYWHLDSLYLQQFPMAPPPLPYEPHMMGQIASKSHTAKSPIPCSVCGRVFTHTYTLKRHLEKHSNSQHSCELCGKSYVRLDVLHRHRLEVHKVRKFYGCPNQCGFSTDHQAALRLHVQKCDGKLKVAFDQTWNCVIQHE